ncbi:hypothetical protein ORIO_12420 [Cereibacter azotoformans]|uniref:hypothetical protein n=1 Tax=Cereibacter azotoformans TaxID=43057 RepID=UPI001EEBDD7A|nr:hypothetical protein [Cereibacter azotoformans]ULB10708.1 hypothetical protein ORIO_12420 [Cereibacter azotoformans]
MSELRTLDQIISLADNGQYQPLLLQENDDLISEIVDFSQAYGTKAGGKLQITISYTTDRFGQIDLTVEHKITKPKAPKAKATAWTVDGGGLTIANPNQSRMEIREVAGRRQLRTPGADE